MPVHIHVDGDLLELEVMGTYPSEELRAKGADALHHPDLRRPARVLMDMSRAEGLERRETAQFERTARFFASYAPFVARVAVVAPDALRFGLMRLGAAFAQASGLETRVFHTRDEAMAWLDEVRDSGAAGADPGA